jgi:hypothetical protein
LLPWAFGHRFVGAWAATDRWREEPVASTTAAIRLALRFPDLGERRQDANLGRHEGRDVEADIADHLLDGGRTSGCGHRHTQFPLFLVKDHNLQAAGNVEGDQTAKGVRRPTKNRRGDGRHVELFRQRLEKSVFIDKAELQQLGPQTAAAVMTGLQPRVQLCDRDRTSLEQDLPQPFHGNILP